MRIERSTTSPDIVIEAEFPREAKRESAVLSLLEEQMHQGLKQLERALADEPPKSEPAPQIFKILEATSSALLQFSARKQSVAELKVLPEIQQTLHMIEVACGDSAEARMLRSSLPSGLIPEAFAHQYPKVLASIKHLAPTLEELAKHAVASRREEVTLDIRVKGKAEDVAAFESATTSAALRELAEQQVLNAEHHDWDIVTDENETVKRLLPPPGSHRAVIQPVRMTTVTQTVYRKED